MQPTTRNFDENASAALRDPGLQHALAGLRTGLVAQRAAAVASYPEFEVCRDVARDIRDHVLANLDVYLETFEQNARAAGTEVHWASDAAAARAIVLSICREQGARTVAKGKSMISEEIALNAHLEAAGIDVIETDLGEYIIQLRGETPSHIIAPAIHLTPDAVAKDFYEHHTELPDDRRLETPAEMVAEARRIMRAHFARADVGITGANFLIAETGSSLIVTNEGNGDLVQIASKIHIVIASIEKVVPTLADASALLRVLARSATGQVCTTYTTLSTGPRRPTDPEGPDACHVVLLDNGRSDLLATELREILRCIRCGACMNHCPVYEAIGGHAYGWVYPGPLGAVLTPALLGVDEAGKLPEASSFCGRCVEVCPVKIPLTDLMRRHREARWAKRHSGALFRLGLATWGWLARRPRAYHLAARFAVALLGALGRRRGRFRWLPGARSWTRHRDLPAPQGRTFQQLWAERQAGVEHE